MPKTELASDLFDRVPPQNLEAERSVLGCMLLANESIDEVSDIIQGRHFYLDAHRLIAETVLTLYERMSGGIDAVTLAEELEKRDQLEEIGGPTYIAQILDSVPHAAHAKYYAQIIRDKWVLRSLRDACTQILRETYDDAEPVDQILQSAEKRIFQILERMTSADTLTIREILMDTFDRINDRLELDGAISGLGTGFTDLDAKTNGLQASELIILAARPSMGKTALVCNIAESVASAGTGVVLFSLEQSKLELAERFLSIRARVDGHKLRKGDLSPEDRDRLMQASSELSELPLFIDDHPGRTMGQISAISRRMKRRFEVGVIIIDYLQLIEAEDARTPREQQIAQITRRLKHLSKEMNVPVIALAQLNRGVELREDKRPRLADLRESGAIEQDADLVLFLHRPDAYNPEDRPGEAELIVAKHRSGPTGIVQLTWVKQTMRFENHSGLDEPEGGYFSQSDSF